MASYPYNRTINIEEKAAAKEKNKRIGTKSFFYPLAAKFNKKLLQGVQGDGFLEKSPPGRRRQNQKEEETCHF
jgi:hypothetical protein